MMRSEKFDSRVKRRIGASAHLCEQPTNAGKMRLGKRDCAPSQRPHGVAICRQSIAKSAISCGTWRGGIGTSPIDAIRGASGMGNRAEAERSVPSARTIRPRPLFARKRSMTRSRT